VGTQCEILCERGLKAVPLLIPLLNLTVLGKGALPLHASAFNFAGRGVVTTGWSKGGKTESLLSFMARGAEYVGDEWVYLSGDGRHMYGIPEPIRVWNWHLAYLPKYRPLVGWDDRARLGALKALCSMGSLVRNGPWRRLPPAGVVNRLLPIAQRQMYVDLHPRALFGPRCGAMSGNFDRLFFVVSHESPDVTIMPIDAQEVAARMVFSLQYERNDFLAHYCKYRFAFPSRRNELIETAEARQRELLARIFAGKQAYVVYHPYPVNLDDLFESMRLYL
jgi:hypothetical protein